MPKYNLMDTADSDFFAKLQKPEEQADKAKDDQNLKDEQNLLDDKNLKDEQNLMDEQNLLDEQNLKDEQNLDDISELHPSDELYDARASEEILDEALLAPSIEEGQPEEDELDTFDTFSAEEEEDDYTSEQKSDDYESRPISRTETFIDDFDEKQPGINIKPILIAIAIIVVGFGAYLLISNLFFGDKTTTIPETIAETPQEKLKREQESSKLNFLNGLNEKNRHRLNYINSLVSLKQGKIRYSSILLYDMSLNLEVFVNKRDDLANYNMQLKQNQNINNYKIESVDFRPGSKGGYFALYDIILNTSGSSGGSNQQIEGQTPDSWVNNTSSRYGLQLKSRRQVLTKQENLFSVNRTEFIFNGPENKCHDLIKNLVSPNTNLNIHKLSLLPTNQRDMTTASYQIQLVVDFYM